GLPPADRPGPARRDAGAGEPPAERRALPQRQRHPGGHRRCPDGPDAGPAAAGPRRLRLPGRPGPPRLRHGQRAGLPARGRHPPGGPAGPPPGAAGRGRTEEEPPPPPSPAPAMSNLRVVTWRVVAWPAWLASRPPVYGWRAARGLAGSFRFWLLVILLVILL